jgi:hypothetical protein
MKVRNGDPRGIPRRCGGLCWYPIPAIDFISDFLFSCSSDMFCKNQVAKAPDGNGGVYAGNTLNHGALIICH